MVGACAAEPIDAAQAATLAASLPPAASAVCCPAAEGGGLLLFEPGSPDGVGVEPTESTRSLLGALGLRPVRARLAVSTGSGGDGMRESELLGRLRQCCLRAGSALVPPGEGASAAVAALLPAVNAGGGRSSGGKGSKGSKGKQAGGETAAAAATVEEGANAAMGGFAEVAVLLSQTPAPGYGSPAVQVRGHIGAPTLHSLTTTRVCVSRC